MNRDNRAIIQNQDPSTRLVAGCAGGSSGGTWESARHQRARLRDYLSAVRRGLGPCEAIIKISSTGVFLQCLRCGCVAPRHHIQNRRIDHEKVCAPEV